jgi:hypothetical protein
MVGKQEVIARIGSAEITSALPVIRPVDFDRLDSSGLPRALVDVGI